MTPLGLPRCAGGVEEIGRIGCRDIDAVGFAARRFCLTHCDFVIDIARGDQIARVRLSLQHDAVRGFMR